jgi:hypothetical protein
LAGMRPGRRNESVVVVGITVDHAATKVRDERKSFTFEEVEEIGGQGATIGIFDVCEKFAGPEGTCEIPLQIALSEGMREIEERGIDFGEEAAEALEKFGGMRIGLSKDRAGQECEKPDKAGSAVGELSLGEEFTIAGGIDARKRKMGSALGEVSKSAALHVDECGFAGWMHDLQDKFAGIRGHEVEVVVVFTGERTGGGVDAVEGEGQARGF